MDENRQPLFDRFAKNLSEARAAVGISQEELSAHSGVHQTQISSFERALGLPSIATLLKLCVPLESTPNDLLDGITWELPLPSPGTYQVSFEAPAGR